MYLVWVLVQGAFLGYILGYIIERIYKENTKPKTEATQQKHTLSMKETLWGGVKITTAFSRKKT